MSELPRDGGNREEVGNGVDEEGGELKGVSAACIVAGLVPERFRDVSWDACVVTMNGGLGLVLSCAADSDGRSRRLGVGPLAGNDAISSPLAEGPADDGFDEFWDLTSVDPLPLRLRRRYFSIAFASCSRTRLAIGERADAGLIGCSELEENAGRGEGEGTENVPVLLEDDAPDPYGFR